MPKVYFTDDGIEIDMEGIEKLLAIKGRLSIPYSHITGVDENAERVRAYLRVGGTALGPRHYDYGRFLTNQGPGFYALKNLDKAFAIHTRDEKYSVIVLELEDNDSVIEEIEERTGKQRAERE
jgi:hypothetical protein